MTFRVNVSNTIVERMGGGGFKIRSLLNIGCHQFQYTARGPNHVVSERVLTLFQLDFLAIPS